MHTNHIIAAGVVLGSGFLFIMALVTRILLHKHTKQTTTADMQIPETSDEHHHQLSHISTVWKRLLVSKQDHVKGHWVPTLSGMIKAGDEGLFSSALFANLHGNPGEFALQTLYEVFAEELRSRPMTQRSAYSGEIPKFLSSTKRVASAPKRAQSVSHRRTSQGQAVGSLKLQRKSMDLSTAERGLVRGMSIKKPAPTLVSVRKGFSALDGDKNAQTSWMKDVEIAGSRYGSMAVKITPAELAALSIILGSPVNIGKRRDYTPFEKGASNISILSCVTEDGKDQITLRQHKRNTTHMPAKGSGFSTLFAKHFAAGSLPYSQEKKTVHSIIVSNYTVKAVQTGSPLYLHDSSFKTKQSRYLTSLPSSRELSFHIASTSPKPQPLNPFIGPISALPFVGGLVPLAMSPLIKTVQFIASGGLPPGRLLQRLEGLVDKVNRQALYLHTFGQLYDPHNGALLYRERERLGRLATGASTTDLIADKASRMQRYVTLLERLMALVSEIKPHDVLASVQEATERELEQSYTDAVAAYHTNRSRSSSVVDSHGCPESDARSKRNSIQSHMSGPRSQRSSSESIVTFASPASFAGSQTNNLGKQVEGILKAELPFSIESIATVARLVIVAWTLSVEVVAWEDGEEGFRVADLKKLPENMVLC